MQDFTKGFDNSGGWRFKDKKSSNDFLSSIYSPEAYNGGLLDSVGNPNRGALDKALAVKPIDNIITTGLLEERGGGGDGFGGMRSNAVSESSENSGGGPYSDRSFANMEGLMGGLAGFAAGGIPGAIKGYSMGESLSNQRQAGFADSNAVTTSEASLRAAAQARMAESAAVAQAQAQAAATEAAQTRAAAQAHAEAQARSGGGGATSASSGNGSPGHNNAGSTSGSDRGEGGGSSSSSRSGLYMGGEVTRGNMSGPNPRGPDDGYVALDDGEFVVKASSVKKYGKGLLSDINNGTFKR